MKSALIKTFSMGKNDKEEFIKANRLRIIVEFFIAFSLGSIMVGQLYNLATKPSFHTWESDYYQSSNENILVTVDLFDNAGEALPRFLMASKKCVENTEWENTIVTIGGTNYNYRYACTPGNILIAGKGLEEMLRTGNYFAVSEKHSDPVIVHMLDTTYTFNAAGYRNAVKKMTNYYRGK